MTTLSGAKSDFPTQLCFLAVMADSLFSSMLQKLKCPRNQSVKKYYFLKDIYYFIKDFEIHCKFIITPTFIK